MSKGSLLNLGNTLKVCGLDRLEVGRLKRLEFQNGKNTPRFFVSVASKGFSNSVSLLFATLAGRSISVAAKGLKARVGSDPTGAGASPSPAMFL